MTYSRLVEYCQSFEPPIGRNVIRDKLLEIVGVDRLRVVRTTLDATVCRGMYLSARNADHPFVRQNGGHVIALARGLDRSWERFVFVKEIMHMFDDPMEATDSGDKLEQLLEDFGNATKDKSAPYKSEVECFWMAMGALCPERARLEFIRDREAGQIDDYAISLRLQIPVGYVAHLFKPTYAQLIRAVTENNA